MSDSGEDETSVQESQHDETDSCKDAEEDEDFEYKISILECTNKDVLLPLNCSICEKPFTDPVITTCQHYFCKNCALEHHTKNNTCFVCNDPTLGVFITAVEVKKRIARERKKARDMAKEVFAMIEKTSTMVDDAVSVAEKVVKMVEEVETLVDKASSMATAAGETAGKAVGLVQEAGVTTEIADVNMVKAVKMVEEVETLVEKAAFMATEAGEMAVKSAEMVQEAWNSMEIVKVNLTKAFAVTKTVM